MTPKPWIAATITALAFGAVACDDTAFGPEAFAEVRVVAPDLTWVGDTVQLIGIVTNPTDEAIEATAMSCAPGIGFVVTDPFGQEVNLYEGLDFLCPRLDSHDLLPGETDAVFWEWIPKMSGIHTVRSVLLTTGGAWQMSPEATVGVRPE